MALFEVSEQFFRVLFPGLIILFVITQSIYFVNNIVMDLIIYRSSSNIVSEDNTLGDRPTIHILVPVYKEPRPILEQTISSIINMDYPSERLKLYLITEPDDEVVQSYIKDFVTDIRLSELTVEQLDDTSVPEPTVEQLTVERSTIASYVQDGQWQITGEGVPRTKASALKYAFRTLALAPEDVITVFDADTIVPDDTFTLAVNGLTEYDVVQAKQTVRNHDDGWLPQLEAMGIAAWCHTLYEKNTKGPYQLLGKAYFFTVEDLWEIGDWRVDAITEDLALGIDAYEEGYSLGIIDRYIQDICPAEFSAWVNQKRRWTAGPYPHLRTDSFDFGELFRFWMYSATNQVISLVNVIGVPTGILYFLFVLAGFDLYNSPPLVVITLVNLVNWGYYSTKMYQATIHGVRFDSGRQRLKFYLSSNPLTQLIYSMLWAIPVSLAIRDYVWGSTTTEFHVTPKQTDTTDDDTNI